MEARTSKRLAVAGLAVMLVGFAVGLALWVARVPVPLDIDEVGSLLVFGAFGAIGALILSRRPGHPIGLVFLTMGVATGLLAVSDSYARAVPALPGREWAAWAGSWLWALAFTGVALSLLLFPDGHPPSRRWRVVAWAILTGSALLVVGIMLTPQLAEYGVRNPLGVAPVEGTVLEEGTLGWPFLMAGMLGAVVAMLVRFWRSRGQERQRLKWLAASAAAIGLAYALTALFSFDDEDSWGASLIFFLALCTLPVGTAIGILRHRLFDIDLVISRALVYGVLAAFIVLVYSLVVVAVPYLVAGSAGSGSATAEPSLALSIAATAIVAIAFHPLRVRVQRWANRVVYGQRATPYEVLTAFSDRVAETYGIEDVLPRMARIVAQGTGARQAVVWLHIGDQMSPAARWPAGDGAPAPSPVGGLALDDTLFARQAGQAVVPIRHHGEPLGALSIEKPPGERLAPAEEALLRDLASQAGLVLRNVRLTEELKGRLDQLSVQAAELRASRQRIVEAQDAERRRLERNIHDGAQQHLVALAVKLRLAKTVTTRDPERARGLIEEIRAETTTALATLRDLARGIYPPLLVERGVGEALRSHGAGFSFDLDVRDENIGRHTREVEAAMYFAVLESLQNAAKHAHASRVVVTLEEQGDELAFSVTDDGVGFDPAQRSAGSGLRNLADRVESVGGTLWVDSAPGRGTTVAGRVPARAMEGVAR